MDDSENHDNGVGAREVDGVWEPADKGTPDVVPHCPV